MDVAKLRQKQETSDRHQIHSNLDLQPLAIWDYTTCLHADLVAQRALAVMLWSQVVQLGIFKLFVSILISPQKAVSIFDKNDDHPCPPSELRNGNPHKRVIHKVLLPRTGSTGPQFGQKLGRKLKGSMKEVHMKKEQTKLVFFSHPPTQIGLHKSFTPQFGIFGTCASHSYSSLNQVL